MSVHESGWLIADERLDAIDVGERDANERRVETQLRRRGGIDVVDDVQQKDPRVTQTGVTAARLTVTDTAHVDRPPTAAPRCALHPYIHRAHSISANYACNLGVVPFHVKIKLC